MHAACDDVANMRRVVAAYAGLIRTSFTEQDAKWRDALSALPETSAELCGTLLSVPTPSESAIQDLPSR